MPNFSDQQWVALDVVVEAFRLPGKTLTARRAHRIAVDEAVRMVGRGPRRQYRWGDVRLVAKRRRTQTATDKTGDPR